MGSEFPISLQIFRMGLQIEVDLNLHPPGG
jgi:hypothetical protein